MKSLKNTKGVTLIALVITIIVLLILAGVSISMLTGDNGILTKAQSAKEEHIKSEAIDTLKMKITEAQMNMKLDSSSEKGLQGLANALCDIAEEGTTITYRLGEVGSIARISVPSEAVALIVELPKYNYEMEIDSNFNVISITDKKTNIKTDLVTGQTALNIPYTLTYDANTGVGTIEAQSVRPGVGIKLKENTFTKERYFFAGWNTNADGTGTKYEDREIIKIYEDTTLYAQWEEVDDKAPTVTITMEQSSVFGIKSTVEITDESGVDFSKCKYIYTTSQEEIGTDLTNYTEGEFEEESTIIEKAKGAGTYYLHVIATDMIGNVEEIVSNESIAIASSKDYEYTGQEQTASLLPGKYKFEVWGAQGGGYGTTVGGKGGYSTGILELLQTTQYYIYVGGQGLNSTTSGWVYIEGGWNGGGATRRYDNYASSGGGATDICTVQSSVVLDAYQRYARTEESYKSRIIVAGGGGGARYSKYSGEYGGGTKGGGLNGYSNGIVQTFSGSGNVAQGSPGTQTSGGNCELYTSETNASISKANSVAGSLGLGSTYYSTHSSNTAAGGGGGGYYGGGTHCHGGRWRRIWIYFFNFNRGINYCRKSIIYITIRNK